MIKQELLKSKEIKKAIDTAKAGGVIIFPTDTVYGIGCKFNDLKAIERIYQIKNTPKSQNFPVLISNINQLKKIARITKVGLNLIKRYWPGAVTIILPSRSDSSAAPQNDTSKVGFRMPDSDLTRFLIEKVGVPIVGTSANIHGQKAVKSFKDLDPKIIKLADFTIKGKCQKGIESTVIDATTDPPKIIRQGAVDVN